jgi:hypothetical protein
MSDGGKRVRAAARRVLPWIVVFAIGASAALAAAWLREPTPKASSAPLVPVPQYPPRRLQQYDRTIDGVHFEATIDTSLPGEKAALDKTFQQLEHEAEIDPDAFQYGLVIASRVRQAKGESKFPVAELKMMLETVRAERRRNSLTR